MFSSSDEHLVEAVYKKHGFDTAVDILLYSTPESDTKAVSSSSCIVCYVTMLHVFKAYCVCRSNCCALPLYAIKLTKARAIFTCISPRMWLGQYQYITRPLLHHELCHSSMHTQH